MVSKAKIRFAYEGSNFVQLSNSISWQKNLINKLQKIGSLLSKSGLAIQFIFFGILLQKPRLECQNHLRSESTNLVLAKVASNKTSRFETLWRTGDHALLS